MKVERGGGVGRRSVLAGAGAGAVAAAVPLRLAQAQGKTLKIGAVLPRSGIQANFGQDSVRGIELALEVLGAKGYPKVEIVHADNETKVDVGRAQAEKLIDQGCGMIFGCYDSGITAAVAQVCEQKGVPLVINVAAAPQLTDGRFKVVFRNFPTGPMIASDAFLLQKEVYQVAGKAPSSCVMLHANDTFGTTQKNASVALIGKFGMPYSFKEVISYDPTTRDLSAEVRKAKGTGAELVWIITRLNDAIMIVQEMVKQRWVPMGIVSTGPGPYDDPFLKQLGKFSDDIINMVPWFDPNKAMSKAMIAAWDKKFPGRTLNTSVSHSFEAMLIALDAYKRAGSAEPAKLIEALRATNIADNVTVGPAITFNAKGQNEKTRNSAIQNRGGKLLSVAPAAAAVTKPIWPMRAWNKR
ncbi:MAG: ABC transporter substrate-binding protein [Rhodospirillaceae bacterium]|nr:ABC transporter substrate-binding protein [Rhodospirillaceae bacterium]